MKPQSCNRCPTAEPTNQVGNYQAPSRLRLSCRRRWRQSLRRRSRNHPQWHPMGYQPHRQSLRQRLVRAGFEKYRCVPKFTTREAQNKCFERYHCIPEFALPEVWKTKRNNFHVVCIWESHNCCSGNKRGIIDPCMWLIYVFSIVFFCGREHCSMFLKNSFRKIWQCT